jgi:thymidine phosphorylase
MVEEFYEETSVLERRTNVEVGRGVKKLMANNQGYVTSVDSMQVGSCVCMFIARDFLIYLIELKPPN